MSQFLVSYDMVWEGTVANVEHICDANVRMCAVVSAIVRLLISSMSSVKGREVTRLIRERA